MSRGCSHSAANVSRQPAIGCDGIYATEGIVPAAARHDGPEPVNLGARQRITICEIEITECEMVNQFAGSRTEPPQFTRGYGLAFGHSERKAMAMALVDRALRAAELGEDAESPAQMQEFVLSHSDSLEASGFVQHLKLPHYVDFQSELELVRKMRHASAQPPDEAAA